jgi:branched-chain amino acid transport system permease protein
MNKSIITKILLAAAVVLALLVPTFTDNRFILTLLIGVCFAIANTCAYNLILGYTGLMSFGQSGFYAVGAYGSALLSIRLMESWPDMITWPFGLVFAGILSAILAAGVGALVLKLQGAYFAMVTFAFSMLVVKVADVWEPLTHGVYGLRGVPKLFPDVQWIYVFAVVMVVLVYFVVSRMVNSQYGRILVAVREDENVARSAGVNVFKYKMVSFIVSSAITGIMGGIFAHYLRYVSPEFGNFGVSTTMLTATIVGGPGYLLGPGIAAVIFALLPEWLRGVGEYNLLVNGIIMVVVVLFMPGGFEPYFKTLYYKFKYSRLLTRQQG